MSASSDLLIATLVLISRSNFASFGEGLVDLAARQKLFVILIDEPKAAPAGCLRRSARASGKTLSAGSLADNKRACSTRDLEHQNMVLATRSV